MPVRAAVRSAKPPGASATAMGSAPAPAASARTGRGRSRSGTSRDRLARASRIIAPSAPGYPFTHGTDGAAQSNRIRNLQDFRFIGTKDGANPPVSGDAAAAAAEIGGAD